MISKKVFERWVLLLQAIDRLPLIPGVLELVGIGYSGVSWICFIALFFYNFYTNIKLLRT